MKRLAVQGCRPFDNVEDGGADDLVIDLSPCFEERMDACGPQIFDE
jgi:hypothetical protein